MKNKKDRISSLKPVAAVLGSAVVLSSAVSTANAAENPFQVKSLGNGYMISAEAKCGESKCGSASEKAHGKTDKHQKKTVGDSGSAKRAAHAEGKCGESKCGGEKSEGEGKCGESKCGGEKSEGEGKCGESKCGGSN